MSSRNDETSGMAMALVVVGAIAAFAFLFMFALAAFVALIFTALSVCAWNAPLRIGKHTITPEEARGFVGRGLAGAVLVPLFAAFAGAVFNLRLPPEVWGYSIIGGYVLGSLGVAYLMAKQNQADGVAEYMPQPRQLPPPLPAPGRAQPEQPFRYASWDDEENRP